MGTQGPHPPQCPRPAAVTLLGTQASADKAAPLLPPAPVLGSSGPRSSALILLGHNSPPPALRLLLGGSGNHRKTQHLSAAPTQRWSPRTRPLTVAVVQEVSDEAGATGGPGLLWVYVSHHGSHDVAGRAPWPVEAQARLRVVVQHVEDVACGAEAGQGPRMSPVSSGAAAHHRAGCSCEGSGPPHPTLSPTPMGAPRAPQYVAPQALPPLPPHALRTPPYPGPFTDSICSPGPVP